MLIVALNRYAASARNRNRRCSAAMSRQKWTRPWLMLCAVARLLPSAIPLALRPHCTQRRDCRAPVRRDVRHRASAARRPRDPMQAVPRKTTAWSRPAGIYRLRCRQKRVLAPVRSVADSSRATATVAREDRGGSFASFDTRVRARAVRSANRRDVSGFRCSNDPATTPAASVSAARPSTGAVRPCSAETVRSALRRALPRV